MKYLVVLLVVMVAVYLWRSNRREIEREEEQRQPPPRRPSAPGVPQDMVRCPVCAVHLPRVDALPGPNGQLFCCVEHRQRAEQ